MGRQTALADGDNVQVERLTTGVPTLDAILHGGFPSRTLNIVTGGPGAGKSILALQLLFHQARLGQRNIYFTSIAEPSLKFLRYMQQFEFFDPDLFDKTIFFSDLSGPALSQGLKEAVDSLKRQIADRGPAIIAIDSFKALRSRLSDPSAAHGLLYELVVDLAISDVTAFMVGEYDEYDVTHLPEFFAADSIINLSRLTDGLRVSRQLEVLKLRGSSYEPGRHFFDISSGGIKVYPRVSVPTGEEMDEGRHLRLSTGVAGLDRMLEGGLPELTSTVLEGGTGTGKTTLALSFLAEGARVGEPGLFLALDETRAQIIKLAVGRGWDVRPLMEQGLLEVVFVSPLNYVADALLQHAKEHIQRMGAKRVVIDSLSSLNLSIAAEGRGPELVYALVKTFRAMGVTSILTNETSQLLGTTELGAHGLSAVADNIVMLRYAEVEARLARGISVLKVRGSGHDDRFRELTITGDMVEVGEPFQPDRGVLTGTPTPHESGPAPRRRGKGGARRPQSN
jgi:circadian clock protein KaiC